MSTSRKFSLIALAIFSLVINASALAKDGPMKLTIVKVDQDRKYVLAEKQVPASRLTPPFKVSDELGKAVKCQWEASSDGQVVRWVVMEIAAGASPIFTLDHTNSEVSEKVAINIKELEGGSLSISNQDHEITRYNVGPMADKFKKPFFYPVMSQGVSVTRSWPMEEKEGEAKD